MEAEDGVIGEGVGVAFEFENRGGGIAAGAIVGILSGEKASVPGLCGAGAWLGNGSGEAIAQPVLTTLGLG